MIDEVCFEMANIKQTRLKMEEKKKIRPNDKEKIKWAVLESAAKNTSLTPFELAESLYKAFILIQADTCSKDE